MPFRLGETFRDRLRGAGRPLVGAWICSGSPVAAEIIACSGFDWVLIDMEHAPNGLESVLAQLHAVSGYPVTPVVRVPSGDPVVIKQVLDIGARSLLVPMVSSADEAREVARAVAYPPAGMRGVGAALARSGRWGRVRGYLEEASSHVSVAVQIETLAGVEQAAQIASTPGVDQVLVGPSDLAASMGLIGMQTHPDVVAEVARVFEAAKTVGRPVGVNAFDLERARGYLRAGAGFVLVGADVSLLARSAEALAASFRGDPGEADQWQS